MLSRRESHVLSSRSFSHMQCIVLVFWSRTTLYSNPVFVFVNAPRGALPVFAEFQNERFEIRVLGGRETCTFNDGSEAILLEKMDILNCLGSRARSDLPG